ncbi:hypothetical protein JOD45_000287 [Scopulibacillus daqui]|uniref:Uncharacterized protein n=1 Tax=Scopulibacillus daqui TaxID=1469162 RepID=A0ABS2PVY8_9BACL|nr:hypothetical protein [Scopulibacillus daqui]MBM7644096.1 hypothetical protein [Scopulibacillus daqui]
MPQQGQQQRNNAGNIFLPLLAAIGTGAATYYSLRNNQNAGQQMQQLAGMNQNNQQNQYS